LGNNLSQLYHPMCNFHRDGFFKSISGGPPPHMEFERLGGMRDCYNFGSKAMESLRLESKVKNNTFS
jgi:hypothetical protein